MARIRSIKPEFPQSESMGRVSRDARLLFVMLWPICDDHGRTRASSRLLASLLFPYDSDAPKLMDGWLAELEHEGCIERYLVGGSTYLHIPKWLIHQKIDKPSKPQYPGIDEGSRGFESIREDSSEEGKGREGKGAILSHSRATADRFGDFWSAYPNKKGKAEAEKKWRALKLDSIADTIIADVKQRIASDRQWRDPKYIPHGSTYVNGRGWEDAVEPVAPVNSAVRNGSAYDDEDYVASLMRSGT